MQSQIFHQQLNGTLSLHPIPTGRVAHYGVGGVNKANPPLNMVKFSQRPPCKEPIKAHVVTCRAGLLQTFQFTLDYRSQTACASFYCRPQTCQHAIISNLSRCLVIIPCWPLSAVVMSVFSTDWVDMFWKKGFRLPPTRFPLRMNLAQHGPPFALSFLGAPSMSHSSISKG